MSQLFKSFSIYKAFLASDHLQLLHLGQQLRI